MLKLALVTAVFAMIAGAASAQPAAGGPAGYPRTIPASGGHVVIPGPQAQRAYDEIKYAPARRAGDVLYISGVIAGPGPNEARDAEAFKAQVRRALNVIRRTLEAEGLTFADVTMINTFHVWDGPGFKGSREEQFRAFSAAKDEVMGPPHPAWTAVGTTGLLAPDGVVEIQMIAYAPQPRARR